MARGLSKTVVVDEALAALDELGVEGLTVRALATRLGVQAPALYWHVKSKQDLLDEMATELWRRILARVRAETDGLAWLEQLRVMATVTRAVLLEHRDGAKLFGGTFITDPTLLASQESDLERLVAEGVSLETIVNGYALLYNFTVGFCIEEQAVRQAPDERYSLEERARRVDAEANPLVGATGSAIFANQDERFASLVGILLDAIGRMS